MVTHLKRRSMVLIGLCLSATLVFAAAQTESAEMGPDVVTVMTWENDDASYPLTGEQPIIDLVEQALNVEFDWRVVPIAELGKQLALLIASGSEMPDLFTAHPEGMTPSEMADKGVIIPWSDMLDAGNMPKLSAKLAQPAYQAYKGAVSERDGRILGLPSILPNRFNYWALLIRQDWLNNAGLDVPATVDDYQAALSALVAGDANGNGQADEIGWSSYYGGSDWVVKWYPSFGIGYLSGQPSGDDHYSVENDQVYFVPTSDRFKAMLEWLNGMFEQGLIDQDIFQLDSPKFNSQYQQMASFHLWLHVAASLTGTLRNEQSEDAHVIPILDPTSAIWDGSDRFYPRDSATIWSNFLAKGGPNTDAAVRVVDYTLGDTEFPLMGEIGIEGEHHVIENGEVKFIGKWAELPSRFYPMGSAVGRVAREYVLYENNRASAVEPLWQDVRDFEELISPWAGAFVFWKLTGDESEVAQASRKEFDDYVDEMVAKFVTGQESFSGWDAYVDTLNRIAGEEIEAALAVYQGYYDEFLKGM